MESESSEPSALPLIPLARPSLGEEAEEAAVRVLRSGRLVLGPYNAAFESSLRDWSGRAHAVCVTSGTTALELALWAVGVGSGDEVIVPAASYPAAAAAAVRAGARPIAVDIDPATWNLDTAAASRAITARTRAIICVDTFGLVAEAAPLEELARSAGLVLIGDAACSLGGFDSAGVPGGGYGVVATYSFHPRKVITTGEGGALVCDDEDIAARLGQLRNQGQRGRGEFVRVGTNARMDELSAAIGCTQIARLDAMLTERRLLVSGYQDRLQRLFGAGKLTWQMPAAGARPAWQTFAVLLDAAWDRDAICAHLLSRRIETTVATYALHRLPSLAGEAGIAGSRFPVAEALDQRGLALPLYIGMRAGELDRVCEALAEALT